MGRIILTNVAKYGVRNATEYKPTKEQQEKYNQLVKEANERIRAYHAEQFNVYQRASNYNALSNGPTLSLKCKNK